MDSFNGWTLCFDCTVGHTATGRTSVLRTLLDMRASTFSLRDEAASLMGEGRTPWLSSGECQIALGHFFSIIPVTHSAGGSKGPARALGRLWGVPTTTPPPAAAGGAREMRPE